MKKEMEEMQQELYELKRKMKTEMKVKKTTASKISDKIKMQPVVEMVEPIKLQQEVQQQQLLGQQQLVNKESNQEMELLKRQQQCMIAKMMEQQQQNMLLRSQLEMRSLQLEAGKDMHRCPNADKADYISQVQVDQVGNSPQEKIEMLLQQQVLVNTLVDNMKNEIVQEVLHQKNEKIQEVLHPVVPVVEDIKEMDKHRQALLQQMENLSKEQMMKWLQQELDKEALALQQGKETKSVDKEVEMEAKDHVQPPKGFMSFFTWPWLGSANAMPDPSVPTPFEELGLLGLVADQSGVSGPGTSFPPVVQEIYTPLTHTHTHNHHQTGEQPLTSQPQNHQITQPLTTSIHQRRKTQHPAQDPPTRHPHPLTRAQMPQAGTQNGGRGNPRVITPAQERNGRNKRRTTPVSAGITEDSGWSLTETVTKRRFHKQAGDLCLLELQQET